MKNNSQKLVRASLLLAVAVVFQILGRNIPQINQFFVGPVVNAILILTACICNLWLALAVGALTPLIALAVGQLPAPFAPFIPFIMIGNGIFIIGFYLLKPYGQSGKYAGVLIGALLKSLFLFLSASKLIYLFKLSIPPKIASKLVIMMSTPQFITATIGGILAIVFLNLLLKRKVSTT